MRLIGINGLKHSGKDTVYQIIARDHTQPGAEGRVERRAFADKLKIMAALALGFDRPEDELIALMDEAKEKWIISLIKEDLTGLADWENYPEFHRLTGREYLQNFGNHARRVFGDTFWVDQVLNPEDFDSVWTTIGRNIEGARDTGVLPAIGVITDVRYPNEAQATLDNGGEVWELIRPGLESDGHVTEKPLPRHLVTRVIHNDGSLADLARSVGAAIVE